MEKHRVSATLLLMESIRAIAQGLLYGLMLSIGGLLIGKLFGSGKAWAYFVAPLFVLPLFAVPMRLSALRATRRIPFLSGAGLRIAMLAGIWGLCAGCAFVAFLSGFRGMAATSQDYLLTGFCAASAAVALCTLPACQRTSAR